MKTFFMFLSICSVFMTTRFYSTLGIEYVELCDAHKSVQTAKVDEKLNNGDIDEEKAEKIKTKIADSECGIKPGRHKKRANRQEHKERFHGEYNSQEDENEA